MPTTTTSVSESLSLLYGFGDSRIYARSREPINPWHIAPGKTNDGLECCAKVANHTQSEKSKSSRTLKSTCVRAVAAVTFFSFVVVLQLVVVIYTHPHTLQTDIRLRTPMALFLLARKGEATNACNHAAGEEIRPSKKRTRAATAQPPVPLL